MLFAIGEKDNAYSLSDNSFSFLWDKKHLFVRAKYYPFILSRPRQPLYIWPSSPPQCKMIPSIIANKCKGFGNTRAYVFVTKKNQAATFSA